MAATIGAIISAADPSLATSKTKQLLSRINSCVEGRGVGGGGSVATCAAVECSPPSSTSVAGG